MAAQLVEQQGSKCMKDSGRSFTNIINTIIVIIIITIFIYYEKPPPPSSNPEAGDAS